MRSSTSPPPFLPGRAIQIDGCDHEWFEDRGARCTLLVYVDDATSRLMELRFVPSESIFSYFAATSTYLERHGRPAAFYSVKASIFRINATAPRKPWGMTQFSRALSELNINITCANTPQAKGRVERTLLTLQDRLVKERHLQGISTIEAANAYAPECMASYNERFERESLSDHDAHRPLRDDEDLSQIFTFQEDRKISKELTLHYQGNVYLIDPNPETLRLRGHMCRVYAEARGRVEVRREGRSLRFRAFNKLRRVTQADIVSNKRLEAVLAKIKAGQRERDQQRLVSPMVTLLAKRQIRAARARADAPVNP